MGFIKKHPNYIIGFVVWLCAILSIIFLPKLIFNTGGGKDGNRYSDFLSSLTTEQQEKLEMLELGTVNIRLCPKVTGKP